MDLKPDIGTEDVTLVGAATAEEAKLFHDIGRHLGQLPDGVEKLQFRFGQDSRGDPAVWIVFIAGNDLKPSAKKIESIQQAASKLRDEILSSDTDRWPYIEVVTG
jgi:hypothetical protein